MNLEYNFLFNIAVFCTATAFAYFVSIIFMIILDFCFCMLLFFTYENFVYLYEKFQNFHKVGIFRILSCFYSFVLRDCWSFIFLLLFRKIEMILYLRIFNYFETMQKYKEIKEKSEKIRQKQREEYER